MYLFSLIKQGDVHLHKNEKVLPHDEYAKLLTIEDLIKVAHEDIQAYKKTVEVDCESIKKQAFEAGYKEGLKVLNEKILLLENTIRELKIEVQQQMLPLVLKAAKKIVGDQILIEKETIVSIIQQVIKPVLTHHYVKLYLNKQDKEIVEKEKDSIKNLFERLESFIIEENNTLDSGSCIIETENGIINASLEDQWRAMEAAFMAFSKKSPPQES
jgi:type III secretion protein L